LGCPLGMGGHKEAPGKGGDASPNHFELAWQALFHSKKVQRQLRDCQTFKQALKNYGGPAPRRPGWIPASAALPRRAACKGRMALKELGGLRLLRLQVNPPLLFAGSRIASWLALDWPSRAKREPRWRGPWGGDAPGTHSLPDAASEVAPSTERSIWVW